MEIKTVKLNSGMSKIAKNRGNSQSDSPFFASNLPLSSPKLTAPQGQALRHLVHFGKNTKLTWRSLPPILDPYYGKIERRRFSNGMQFYGIQRKEIPLVSYGVLIKTGSGNESRRQNGVSHFLEHLVFKGTPNLRPGEADRELENLGAGVNAWTSQDGTFYYIYDTPKEALKDAIKIEAEKLQNMLNPPEELLKERFTVVEEIKRSKNNKSNQLYKRLFATVWANHPYRRTVLGPANNIGDEMRVILDPKAGPKASANFHPDSASNEHKTWRKLLGILAASSSPGHREGAQEPGAPLKPDEQKKLQYLQRLLKRRGLTPQQVLAVSPFNPAAAPLSEQEIRTQFKVRDLTREDILGYYAQHYAPKNRSVIVVGDFDMDEVLNTVAEEYNKPFPEGGFDRTYPANLASRKPRAYTQPLSARGVKKDALMREPVKMSTLALGFNFPGAMRRNNVKTILALKLLSTILGGDESSRLYQRLVEKQKIANSVGLGVYTLKERSSFYATASCKPEHLESVKTEINQALAEVAQHGVTPQELSKAKIIFQTQLADNSEAQFDVIGDLAQTIRGADLKHSLGNALTYINAMTSEDIQAAARKYLTDGASRTVSMVPRDYARRMKPSSGRAKPQFAGKLRFSGQLTPMDKSFVLPGGTELIVRERPASKKTAITIGIKGGNRADVKPGETDLMASMIERGTTTFPADKLQEALASRGLKLEVSNGPDGTSMTIHGLSEPAVQAEMFDILGTLFQGPAFAQADLDFVREQNGGHYQNAVDKNPSFVVGEMLSEALYPENHPYGVTSGRIVSAQDKVTVADLQQAYQRLFRRANMTVSVVGNVNADEVQSKVIRMLGNLPEGSSIATAPVPPIKIPVNKVITKSREDIKQAEIMRGWVAPHIHDADRMPLMMMNGILRTGMGSRLFQTFREGEKGLCYQVKTTHVPHQEGGTFQFYIGTDPDNISLVRHLFQKEIDKLVTTLPDEMEMKRTVMLMKSQLLAATQKSDLVSTELVKHRSGKTLSNPEIVTALYNVTPKQVQDVARKYLTQPSVTAILAPEAILQAHGLPVNGEAVIA